MKILLTRDKISTMPIISVKIAEIRQETPLVRVIKINLQNQEFKYKPGQWIDCYAEINGKRHVAGYSLTSSPTKQGFIELAVRVSDNPVTCFIHGEASPGDTLYIDGGQGDVYYDERMGDKVVLAAAGIGVAPLMGILRYMDDTGCGEVSMYHSAGTMEELIYYEELMERSENNPNIRYHPFVTRERPTGGTGEGRITGESLEKHIEPESLFFLSGPGEMIPDIKDYLLARGVDEDRIKYEVWW